MIFAVRPCAATTIAIAAWIALSMPASAQQQGGPPPKLQVIQIDQGTLDRWLVLFQDVGPQLASNPNLSEQQVQAIFQRGCAKAQIADINQCHAIDDYLGALTSGVSDDGTKFIDPLARARQDLAAISSDRTIPAKEKAEQKAGIEGFIASMPDRFPPEHIALLNRNAKRVLDVLAKVQGPPAGQQPPGAAPGPAPKR